MCESINQSISPAASHPIPPPGSQPPRVCTGRHNVYNTVLSGFSGFSIGAADAASRVSGRSFQHGSETSQASYGHPRCNLNLVRLLRLSLCVFLCRFSDAFSSPFTHAAINLQPPFTYCVVPSPRVYNAAILQSPVMPNTRRSSATQSFPERT